MGTSASTTALLTSVAKIDITGTKILVCVPAAGFDPTECGVPFKILKERFKCDFVFAVPDNTVKSECDPIMIDGVGLYLLKWSMRADDNGRAAYKALEESKLLEPPNTITYETALEKINDFDALLLPGGHEPRMRPYLQSKTLHKLVAAFDAKPVNNSIAAVCHGVVVAARAGILANKRVTSLQNWQEGLAHNLTRAWMDDYYKTVPGGTVEDEVTLACKEFVKGPTSLSRDSLEDPSGFTVRDGNLVTARWPGDCHAFALQFARLIADNKQQKNATTTAATTTSSAVSSSAVAASATTTTAITS